MSFRSQSGRKPVIGNSWNRIRSFGPENPLAISITAFGEVPAGQIVRRGGAKPGDVIYVTGTIGDGAFGLDVLQGRCKSMDDDYLIDRYRLPQPRSNCVDLVREYASASMDVSDGLVGDLEQLCLAAGVGAKMNCGHVPFSRPVQSLIELDNRMKERAITGGDDYEILFTVPYQKADAFEANCAEEVRHIGEIIDGSGLEVHTAEGERMNFHTSSWSHFD